MPLLRRLGLAPDTPFRVVALAIVVQVLQARLTQSIYPNFPWELLRSWLRCQLGQRQATLLLLCVQQLPQLCIL